ncbi:MAG: RnfH family protein [Candidatus Accumulibacter sp.]|nr:RnfH family protein [Accumulibacter sp.]
MTESITVEVVYALKDRQELVTLTLPAGVVAREAVERSGLMDRFPEIDLGRNKLGVFARLVKPDTMLRDHDRVEIYRPLIADPKEVRKQRAAEGKIMKKGAGDPGAR